MIRRSGSNPQKSWHPENCPRAKCKLPSQSLTQTQPIVPSAPLILVLLEWDNRYLARSFRKSFQLCSSPLDILGSGCELYLPKKFASFKKCPFFYFFPRGF